MSSDYSTIQQHAPLRVPEGWSRQERAFVVQLEEILDDIYRRFGRLRAQDLGKDLKQLVEGMDGLSYSLFEQTVEGINSDVQTLDDGTIKKTTQYQTAGDIVSEATSQAASAASGTYIAKTNTLQTADQIVASANGYTNGKLTDYSTTTQTATQISQYVTNNAYGKASGISISGNGIDMTGTKHINLDSGEINIGGWRFYDPYGIYYNDPDDQTQQFSIQVPGTGDFVIDSSGPIILSTGTGYGIVLKKTGEQSGKEKVALEPYQSPSTTLVSLGSWDNHVDQVCTDYLYYWNGGMQSSRDSKRDIRLLESCGGKIDQLKPVRFKYKGDDKERIGLIYEEAVDVVPEICSEYDGAKAIDYAGLVPMLLKEIQSLRARVAELEKKR